MVYNHNSRQRVALISGQPPLWKTFIMVPLFVIFSFIFVKILASLPTAALSISYIQIQ